MLAAPLFAQVRKWRAREAISTEAHRSRQRRKIDDEGKRLAEAQENLRIGGQELASLTLGQGDVDAIVNAMPNLEGDFDRAGQERLVRMELRERGQQIGHERVHFRRGNSRRNRSAEQSLPGVIAWHPDCV
jgi:hypothetical protein